MCHPISEYFFWWSQTILLGVAIAAAIIAFVELRTLGRQAKATLLLELDRRFEGPELSIARRILAQIRDQAATTVGLANPLASENARMQLMKPECGRIMSDTRANDPKTYSRVMSVLGFFETVGLMVDQEYVALSEINELFRGPILAIDLLFGDHISERERETGVPTGLYTHARKLAAQVGALPG